MGVLAGVALLTEGVGRNTYNAFCIPTALLSPSSRRAWVEIGVARGSPKLDLDSLTDTRQGQKLPAALVMICR